MDTRTGDKIANDVPLKDTVMPQAPQPVTPEPQADVYAWSPRREPEPAPFVLTGDESEDEPAPDVGGEVGKTPRLLTAWQITGLVLGGIALAAAVVYLARRRD